MSRRRSLAAVMALVMALLVWVPSADAAPTVVVTPSSGLVDGQPVTVTGSGFGPELELWQCAAGATSSDDCVYWDYVDVDLTGAFETTIWALAVPEQIDGTPITDCRAAPGTCEIVAGWPPDPAAVRVPLTFDPTAPLRPAPTIEVTPATDLSLGQVVHVTGEDFDPWTGVEVVQCRTDDVTFEGCDNPRVYSLAADPAGTYEFDWAVGTVIETQAGRFDCRAAPGACVLAVGVRYPPDQTSRPAYVPLTFAAGTAEGYPPGMGTAPPAPPPPLPPGHGGVRYLDEVFSDVEVVSDLVFWPDADVLPGLALPAADLSMRLVMPAGDTETARPVLFAMECGKDAFARRGYVVACPEYRGRFESSGDDLGNFVSFLRQSYVDVTAAMRWLRAHAEEYRIDPEAFAITGLSYGGILSFQLAWGAQNAATEFVFRPPPGPVTFPLPDDPPDLGDVHREQSSAVAAAAPEISWFPPELADPGEAPVILQNGLYDDRFPPDSAQEICPAAKAVGITCEFHLYPVGHGLDFYRPTVDDRTAVFLYDQMLVPLGVVASPAAPSAPTAAAVVASPGLTG